MTAPAVQDDQALVLPLPQELELAVHVAAKVVRSAGHGDLADRLLVLQLMLATWREPDPVETPPPPPRAQRPSALTIELLSARAQLENSVWFMSRARSEAQAAGRTKLAASIRWLEDATTKALPALLDAAYLEEAAP